MQLTAQTLNLSKSLRGYTLFGIVLSLILPALASAGPEDYRFPREPGFTEDGYPFPLTGIPITKTPVIVKTEGASLEEYPEHYIPGQERLAED